MCDCVQRPSSYNAIVSAFEQASHSKHTGVLQGTCMPGVAVAAATTTAAIALLRTVQSTGTQLHDIAHHLHKAMRHKLKLVVRAGALNQFNEGVQCLELSEWGV